MKRMHLHLGVPDLARSIEFYATLFGAPPSVVKPDYAKWMLDDPRVNFAISQRGAAAGVDHVGELSMRLKAAGAATHDEAGAHCCYARSDKSWVSDPAGVRWETFFTYGEATAYGEDSKVESGLAAGPAPATCCGAAREVVAESA